VGGGASVSVSAWNLHVSMLPIDNPLLRCSK
jgi:hypothetical protein